MTTVFLGGTCNESLWRDALIPQLPLCACYNPVVADWTPACQVEEIHQREISDYCLYVITPRMTGVYSIAEVVDDSNKRPEKTLFLVLPTDGDLTFTAGQLKSLQQTGRMVETNGGRFFSTQENLIEFLNS